MPIFHIAGDSSQYLQILQRGERSHQDWVEVQVRVRAGAFYGEYPASLTVYELEVLLADLHKLQQKLADPVKFEALEHALEFAIEPNSRGRIMDSGQACDNVVEGNSLSFRLDLDQSYLAQPITLLTEALKQLKKAP